MTVTTDQRIETIATWLRVFVPADQVTELRALGEGRPPVSRCFRGDQTCGLARVALGLEEIGYPGIYFTPNPLRDGLAGAARDTDVLGRRWLLIDVDPVRPAHTSSTDAEKLAAWTVLDRCRRVLQAAGLRNPVVGDSGNGWHLLYGVDLPNDDASRERHRKLLQGLNKRCGTEQVKIDTSTFNASRIWKLYGTLARKGDGQGDRPWRYSRLIEG